jgi:hypothetical protein
MNTHSTIARSLAVFCLILTTLLLPAQETQTDALAELKQAFTTQLAQIQAPLLEWDIKYLAQLDKMERAAMTEGNLELLVAIRGEKEAFQGGPAIPDTFPSLQRARATYVGTKQRMQLVNARTEGRLLQAYGRSLQDVQAQLTRGGKLERAIAVRSEVERVEAELRTLAARVDQSHSTPAPAPGGTTNTGTVTSKLVGRYPMVEGFAGVVKASYGGSYATYRGEKVESHWIYANGRGESVEWKTAKVDTRKATAPMVTFKWAGANGETKGKHDLYFNGKHILTIDCRVKEDQIWSNDGYELAFDFRSYNQGNSGIYYLTVPRPAILRDKQQRLKFVESESGNGDMDWIMVHGFTDMLEQK